MLSRDFKEFVGFLNANAVDYLVVGGYAMALHGRPRHTGDLDVRMDRRPENLASLMQALRDYGFGGLGLSEDDFFRPDRVVQLGDPPFRIDPLTSIDGVEFVEAWPRRQEFAGDGMVLHFIGIDDVEANQRACG